MDFLTLLKFIGENDNAATIEELRSAIVLLVKANMVCFGLIFVSVVIVFIALSVEIKKIEKKQKKIQKRLDKIENKTDI